MARPLHRPPTRVANPSPTLAVAGGVCWKSMWSQGSQRREFSPCGLPSCVGSEQELASSDAAFGNGGGCAPGCEYFGGAHLHLGTVCRWWTLLRARVLWAWAPPQQRVGATFFLQRAGVAPFCGGLPAQRRLPSPAWCGCFHAGILPRRVR